MILTQDWHPSGHSSFGPVHKGKELFGSVTMPYWKQTLWPDHCVQSSPGAVFHASLKTDKARMVVRKGMNPAIDSYSAFYKNDRVTSTGLS